MSCADGADRRARLREALTAACTDAGGSPPESGAALTSYWLTVSGSYAGVFPTTARALSGAVGPGSYTLGVAAVNPCGAGAQSAPQTVAVP